MFSNLPEKTLISVDITCLNSWLGAACSEYRGREILHNIPPLQLGVKLPYFLHYKLACYGGQLAPAEILGFLLTTRHIMGKLYSRFIYIFLPFRGYECVKKIIQIK